MLFWQILKHMNKQTVFCRDYHLNSGCLSFKRICCLVWLSTKHADLLSQNTPSLIPRDGRVGNKYWLIRGKHCVVLRKTYIVLTTRVLSVLHYILLTFYLEIQVLIDEDLHHEPIAINDSSDRWITIFRSQLPAMKPEADTFRGMTNKL